MSTWQSGLTPQPSILAAKDDLSAPKTFVIDTRAPEEYNGTLLNPPKTGAAFGVARLGHAAGAVNFAFKSFFSNNCLLSCDAFKGTLTSLGWTADMKLVAYCTAGIRSAFFWAMAKQCGLESVANYAGSMFEYAADATKPMTGPPNPLPVAASPTPLSPFAPNTASGGAIMLPSLLLLATAALLALLFQ